MPKGLNPNIYPKGGYHFVERDGAKIFGDTWPGVIRRVESYRKRAGYPAGDATGEVIAQACQREPVICTEDHPANAAAIRTSTLKSRILGWVSRIRAIKAGGGLEFVHAQDARNRADVCAGCQFNTPLPDGCASCRAALKELRGEIVGGRFSDGRLNGCNVLGEDLNTAIHIEQVADANPELPPHCWRKRTL